MSVQAVQGAVKGDRIFGSGWRRRVELMSLFAWTIGLAFVSDLGSFPVPASSAFARAPELTSCHQGRNHPQARTTMTTRARQLAIGPLEPLALLAASDQRLGMD